MITMADHFKPEKYIDRISMKKHYESAKSLDQLLKRATTLMVDLKKKYPNESPVDLLSRAIDLAKEELDKEKQTGNK